MAQYPGAQKAQIRALKCRWVSLGVTWGVPRGALDIVAGQTPPHFFRRAGIAPGGPGRLGHETRQGSLHVALKSAVVRPELGDLNVIIQVEEWHSSDRFGGTVRARESGDFRGERLRRRLPSGCPVYATVATDGRLGPSLSVLPQSGGCGPLP